MKKIRLMNMNGLVIEYEVQKVKDENNSEKDEFSEDAKFRDKIISTPNDTVRVNRLHNKKLAGGVQNNKNIIPNEKNK